MSGGGVSRQPEVRGVATVKSVNQRHGEVHLDWSAPFTAGRDTTAHSREPTEVLRPFFEAGPFLTAAQLAAAGRYSSGDCSASRSRFFSARRASKMRSTVRVVIFPSTTSESDNKTL